MGLTLASTTDRPLQHFILSGNSWIPVRERHREGRGHVVVHVTRSFEFFCRKTFTDCNSNRLSWAGEFENFSFCFLVLFGSSVSQKGSLPFLLMSSSLRLTKLAMVVGRLDRSLSGMLSFFKAWQLKSCYGNTRGGKKQCNIIVCRQKSNRPLVERYKRTESIKSAGGMHRLMLWKSSAIWAALLYE